MSVPSRALADWFEHDISTLRFAILPAGATGVLLLLLVVLAAMTVQQNEMTRLRRIFENPSDTTIPEAKPRPKDAPVPKELPAIKDETF